MLSFITLQSWGKIWSGPSDHWTIFLDYFLDRFLDKFLDLFFYPIWGGGGGGGGGGRGGNTPLVLREWWDAVNQYLGRGER